MRAAGMESNHMLIKRFEPYLVGITNSKRFFDKIDQIIDAQLKEFRPYRKTIQDYLALYFQIGLA